MKTCILITLLSLLPMYILPSAFKSNPPFLTNDQNYLNCKSTYNNKKDCDVTIVKRYKTTHIRLIITCTATANDCNDALEKAADCADEELQRLKNLLNI